MLEKSEVQYLLPDELLHRGSDVVWRTDAERRLLAVSPSVTPLLGWTADELKQRGNVELLDADPLSDADIATFLAGGTLAQRGRIECKDGRLMWFENRMVALLDDAGAVVGYSGILRDIDAQVATEQALAAAEARYRLLAENASDVVLESDNDGLIRWSSPSIQHVLGWSPDEVVGRAVWDLIHPDDLQRAKASADRVRHGDSTHLEVRLRTNWGVDKWLAVSLRPILDACGVVVGRVGGLRDIDAEWSARERLAASEEHLRFVVENVTDVVVHSVEGVPVFVSPTVRAVLGWAPEDFVGRRVDEYYHPDDLAEALELRAVSQVESETQRRVVRMRHLDGEYRWVELAAHRVLQPDGRSAAVGLIHDVTERVLTQQALDEGRARDRVLATLASDVIIIADTESVVRWVAGRTADIIGATHEQLLGVNARSLFVDLPETLERRNTSMNVGDVLRGEIQLRRLDGGTRWVDRTTMALRDGDGVVTGYATSWRDAQAEVDYRRALAESERGAHELAERYLTLSGEAQAANQAKTSFLSRMSHELRTPLNAVLGFAQLLEMDDLNDDQRSAVHQILLGGRHLLDLINEVLDIARIESGRMSLSPETVVVADVIKEALDLVRPLATQYRVTLQPFDGTHCRVHVFVDRQRTIQILLNLLTNGIKYNRAGGHVSVSCAALGGGLVGVEVQDDGIGISEEGLAKLFAPFERLGVESTGIEGTGIGLALSKGLAEMMSGTIQVRSRAGEGSVFSLVLPSADEPGVEAEVAPVRSVPGAAARATSVLYVEDNPANVALMQSILARLPEVSLRVVGRGDEALAAASADPPDLVLLDLHLPDIPGEDVLRRLRLDPRTADVAVVVVSADAEIGLRSRLVTLGADEVLSKPVDVAQLHEWASNPRARRSAR